MKLTDLLLNLEKMGATNRYTMCELLLNNFSTELIDSLRYPVSAIYLDADVIYFNFCFTTNFLQVRVNCDK